jgi:hypothetical protein
MGSAADVALPTAAVASLAYPYSREGAAVRRSIILPLLAAVAVSACVAVPALAGGGSGSMPMPAGSMHMSGGHAANGHLTRALGQARVATAKYVTSLATARKDGYRIITRMIPDMGWHFMNPDISGFDVTKPPILVYERHAGKFQLAALEWVFPSRPKTAPLPGARYGSFPAACHYADGTFVPAAAQADCAPTAPRTGARFTFWHPHLVTMHVWLWFFNPSGLYASMNPFAHAFNRG